LLQSVQLLLLFLRPRFFHQEKSFLLCHGIQLRVEFLKPLSRSLVFVAQVHRKALSGWPPKRGVSTTWQVGLNGHLNSSGWLVTIGAFDLTFATGQLD
jgi:hypothetical protein